MSKRDRCGVKERGLYVQTEKESRTRQLRARAYVCVRSWPRLCTRRLDRRLLGPNEGRRREAKDDVVLGWRDSYGEKVGWIRVRAKAWEGRGGVAGKAAKRDSGEGMITGYHISGSLLRVLRSPPSLPPLPSFSSTILLPLLLLLRPVCPPCILTFFAGPVPRRDAAPTGAEQPPPPPTASACSSSSSSPFVF